MDCVRFDVDMLCSLSTAALPHTVMFDQNAPMLIAIAAALVFVSAADGDTLTVRELATGEKTVLRLAEVDAPERTQPYSQVSRRNLDELCRGKLVEFQKIDVDRYGRTVAHVICDGVNVNWRQVEDGLAWCFTRYLKQPEACLPREQGAKEAKKGLWREASPQAPWDFRAAKRGQGAPAN